MVDAVANKGVAGAVVAQNGAVKVELTVRHKEELLKVGVQAKYLGRTSHATCGGSQHRFRQH